MATSTRLPPDVQSLAEAHRRRHQQLAFVASRRAARLWSRLDASRPAASWTSIGPQLLRLLTGVLVESSRGAQAYVSATVRAWGAEPDPVGEVEEWTFAETASDGRPLQTLLEQPALHAQALLEEGLPPDQARMIGARHLDRIVVTQVADAARAPTGVAMVADRAVQVWVRMLTVPSCARCIVLAGTVYKTAAGAGFARHPRCDCVAIPGVEQLPDLATDPRQYFRSLTESEQNRTFTAAGAQAIRDGANIGQVVNARRGMATAGESRTRVNNEGLVVNERRRTQTTQRVSGRDALTTREGTSRRGFARQRLGRRVARLMPEQIYLDAAGDRDEALRLLRQHGYII